MIEFGTGGWREIIGEHFIKSNLQLLAKAMVIKMQRENQTHKGMVIGYDRRFLSKEAMRWLGEVFASNGITTYLINKSCPTPLVMFYVQKHEFPYGMMVTASHNPAIYNGVKVFVQDGRDASKEVTDEIEAILATITVQQAEQGLQPYSALVKEGKIHEINPINEYLDEIINRIDFDIIRQHSLRVVADPLFGVSAHSLYTLLYTARCEVNMIHFEHDTLFGGKMPAPNVETIRSLQNYVLDYDYDIGIATDGDADRLGIIDKTGHYWTPNEILCLLYYYFLEYKNCKGPVVKNLSTTYRLNKIARHYGQECYEVPVGFKYISAKMQETGAIIGGESSGGLTVKGHINGKDGIYAAMLLIEAMCKTGKGLATLRKELDDRFGQSYMQEYGVAFEAAQKEELMNRIFTQKDLPEFTLPVTMVNFEDGCKIYFENDGWLVIRFSGTEPLLRIFCEMPEQALAKEILQTACAYYNV